MLSLAQEQEPDLVLERTDSLQAEQLLHCAGWSWTKQVELLFVSGAGTSAMAY